MANDSTTILNLVGTTEQALTGLVDINLTQNNTILNSGLAVATNETAKLAVGPRKASMSYILPLSTDDVNVSTDNINDIGDIGHMGAEKYFATRVDLNYGWGFTDVQQLVTQYSAKGGVAAGIATYWNAQYSKIMLSVLDAVSDLDTRLTYTADAEDSLYKQLIMASAHNTGDFQDGYNIALVNPADYAAMRVDQKNTFIPGAQTVSRFDEYAGFRLIKSTKVKAGTMYVARSAAFGFGVGTPDPMVATEFQRLPDRGDGGGADILWSRRSVVIHPQGFSFIGNPLTTKMVGGVKADPAKYLGDKAKWELLEADHLELVGFRKIVRA